MTAVAVRGEVLCEDCATKLSIARRTRDAPPAQCSDHRLPLLRQTARAAALPTLGHESCSATNTEDGVRDGTLAALTSPADLAKEAARVAALAEDVRYGQHSVALQAALVERLEQDFNRRLVATSRLRAAVQSEIDSVLVENALLDADAKQARTLAQQVGEEDLTDEPDAWRSAMLLMSQLEAVEVAIGQAEDELEVACGGEAKVRMDKVETEMAKIVAAAFSGKSTRVQLTPPKDQGPGSPAVHQTVEPEPEPEPMAKPKPDPQRRASSRKAAFGAPPPASLPPLVSELFEEMEKRKANLPALLRRQDVTGSGRLRCEQLGAAVRSGGLSMSAEQAKQLAYQLVAAGEEHEREQPQQHRPVAAHSASKRVASGRRREDPQAEQLAVGEIDVRALSQQWQSWQRLRRRRQPLAESMRLSTMTSLTKESAEAEANRRALEIYEAAPLGVIEELREELDEQSAERLLQAIRDDRGTEAHAGHSVSAAGDTWLALQKRRRYGTALVAMQAFLAEEAGRQRKIKEAGLAKVEGERHVKANCPCATCCELRDLAWERQVDSVTGKQFYANKLTGMTQWDPPALPPPKESAIPKWLRAGSKGVADRHIAAITTSPPAAAAVEQPNKGDEAPAGKGGRNSLRGAKTNHISKEKAVKGKSGPHSSTVAGTNAAGTSPGFASAGLNWYGVFQKHGRLTIGAAK